MSDPSEVITSGPITVHTVTITDTAQAVGALITPPTGYVRNNILQVKLLAYLTAGTPREAVLYGGADALGYIPAGAESILPSRSGQVYLKRFGTSNVTAQIEVCWFP